MAHSCAMHLGEGVGGEALAANGVVLLGHGVVHRFLAIVNVRQRRVEYGVGRVQRRLQAGRLQGRGAAGEQSGNGRVTALGGGGGGCRMY